MSRLIIMLLLTGALVAWAEGEMPAAVPEPRSEERPALTPQILDESIRLLRQHMLLNQTQGGDFVFGYDITTQGPSAESDGVSQATALWGLAVAHRETPSLFTERAMRSGFAFFAGSSSNGPKGRFLALQEDRVGRTSVMALVLLAHLETIAAKDRLSSLEQRLYEEYARQYLTFLMQLRGEDGHFHRYYTYANSGTPRGIPSAYDDGAALLALIKTARIMKLDALKPYVIGSAEAMLRKHVIEALRENPRSDAADAFYTFGSLAFLEIHAAGWDVDHRFARSAISMGKWLVQVHKVLERKDNSAFSYLGLIAGWEIARRLGDEEAMALFRPAIEQGLARSVSWQVGGPAENDYLRRLKVRDPLAVGGVLNAADQPLLRIDVAQQQLQAMILARRFVYTE